MKNKPVLRGRWYSATTAKKWPEGIIVIINRTERQSSVGNHVELTSWFRPDWVENERGYGTEPMKFMRIT